MKIIHDHRYAFSKSNNVVVAGYKVKALVVNLAVDASNAIGNTKYVNYVQSKNILELVMCVCVCVSYHPSMVSLAIMYRESLCSLHM